MEKLKTRHNSVLKALESFRKSIAAYQQAVKEKEALSYATNEEIEIFFRDSVVQRFEYCTDLFWKLLKDYLEHQIKQLPEIIGPNHIFRAASQAKLITEAEASDAIDMVKDRNLTSHMYHEEIAVVLCKNAPKYYELMSAITYRLKTK